MYSYKLMEGLRLCTNNKVSEDPVAENVTKTRVECLNGGTLQQKMIPHQNYRLFV